MTYDEVSRVSGDINSHVFIVPWAIFSVTVNLNKRNLEITLSRECIHFKDIVEVHPFLHTMVAYDDDHKNALRR